MLKNTLNVTINVLLWRVLENKNICICVHGGEMRMEDITVRQYNVFPEIICYL